MPQTLVSLLLFVASSCWSWQYTLKGGHSRLVSLRAKKKVKEHKGFGSAPKCVCGSNLIASKCCDRMQALDVRALASPSEIVRSRYTAYARADWQYIVETTDPSSSSYTENKKEWLATLRDQPYKDYRFLGVDILEENDDVVLFLAKLLHKSTKERADFTERSFFKRDPNRGWLYLGGDVNAPGTVVNLRTGDQLDSLDSALVEDAGLPPNTAAR